LIAERSGKIFTLNNHTQAWKRYDVRPRSNAKKKDQVNKDYCIFHKAHGDYTYNEKWIELVGKIADDKEFEELKNTR